MRVDIISTIFRWEEEIYLPDLEQYFDAKRSVNCDMQVTFNIGEDGMPINHNITILNYYGDDFDDDIKRLIYEDAIDKHKAEYLNK